MASLKYEIPLLDRNTRFTLWQIKMQADVMKEKTATALWKRLEQICMSKTLTSKLHMKQRLYAHRLEKGASIHEDLTMFKEILSNLEAMEVHRESLTVDDVYDSLTSYDKTKHLVVKPDSQGESLITRGRQDRNADNDRGRTQEQNHRSKSKGRLKSSNRGCTFHMSPNQDWFTTYETMSESVVLVGNNASCKIADVGTIKVKMFDGVLSLPLPCHDDIIKLWHMRLGHMSENGMVELSKRGLLDGQGICKLNFYEHYVFEKQKRVRFTKGIHNTKGMLEYIHSDLWGPSRIVQVKRDRETLDSSLYSTVKRRMNRTIMVQCMLSNANLPKSFWAEAASTACFLINRSPSVAIEKKTPQVVWFGNPANYSDLKIFGCPAYAHVDNGKLEPRSIKYVFLELEEKLNSKEDAEADLVAYALNVAEDIDTNREPSNYSEAISCEDSEKWMFAMQKEIKSLHKNRTWDLVKLPKGKKFVCCTWVFKKKEGTPGVEEPRYKAMLVAKGYIQIPGVDFTDVFSPVVKHSSIRALLGIVAMHDLELEKLNAKTTFLHGELEGDIYMQQPEGFTVLEKED
ncbi:hypothetical protein CXB51_001333 [Gossypium anomalum]|uniref:Reverse transcriptase Ty1/copia-type domain-containing protein n=1 Tax=Gossypium anomalum TaxID=47600 RepID=A0A8J5ZPB2_9ROSI|nr:hypothetical protein CXB51_001333 [Gossypium anomalum]